MPNYDVDVIVGKIYRVSVSAPDAEHIACYDEPFFAKNMSPYEIQKIRRANEVGELVEDYTDIVEIEEKIDD